MIKTEQLLDYSTDFWRQEHGRSQTYDAGHRMALRAQLQALAEQARVQASRSASTLSNQFADSYDQTQHDRDVRLLNELTRLYVQYWHDPA